MNVSVVIVTYNAQRNDWLKNCLDSLLNSSIKLSTIVIDNNSSDDTVSAIKNAYPTVKLFAFNQNQGFGKGNNIGIKKSYEDNADYVFLLNQDACIEPETLEKLIKVAGKNVNYGILSPMHLNGKGTALDLKFSSYLSPNNCANLISDFILSKERKEVYSTQYVNAAAWLLTRKCIELWEDLTPCFTFTAKMTIIYRGCSITT